MTLTGLRWATFVTKVKTAFVLLERLKTIEKPALPTCVGHIDRRQKREVEPKP